MRKRFRRRTEGLQVARDPVEVRNNDIVTLARVKLVITDSPIGAILLRRSNSMGCGLMNAFS